MNNGFPGSFTSVGNNMGLSCQPNFNGPQPGHCLLHHVNTSSSPISHFGNFFNSAQNSVMNFARIDQMSAMRDQYVDLTRQSAVHHRQSPFSNIGNRRTQIDRRLVDLIAVKEKIECRLDQCEVVEEAEPSVSTEPLEYIKYFASSKHLFLNDRERAQASKEFTECQSTICKIGAEAKWAFMDLAQGASFGAGVVAGVPVALYEAVDGIVKTASNPSETYQALKSLCQSGNVLGNIGEAFKQSWRNSIDRMEAEHQKGGISGAFYAGVEGGKLTTDIAGLLVGGAGIVKKSLARTEKVAAHAVLRYEFAAANIRSRAPFDHRYSVVSTITIEDRSPLSRELIATFGGMKCQQIFFTKDVILYRAGNAKNPISPFFSFDPPLGILQARIDKAILPIWPNGAVSEIDSLIAMRIPAGTTGFMGLAGYQNGIYVGGTTQIIIPHIRDVKNAKIVEIKPLK